MEIIVNIYKNSYNKKLLKAQNGVLKFMSNFTYERAKYLYGVLTIYYNNIINKKEGFTEDTIINYLKELQEDDLNLVKWYTGERDYELFYDYISGEKKDYDGLEKMHNYLLAVIEKVKANKQDPR